jgi:hypothetical protein
MKRVLLFLGAVPSFFSPAAVAAECSVASGPQSVALLELYTSEGCSSCPPADQWLSRLAAQGQAAIRVIPLSLHVDYWDYIGWHDSFAKPGFAARQREMAALGRLGVVYTPQVMLNGRDYRGWRNPGHFERDVDDINRLPARADIRLAMRQPGPDAIELASSAQAKIAGNHALYVALYENDLTTAVRAGENGGATLHHDHVVREWLGPYPMSGKAAMSWQQQIRLKKEWKTKDLGVAAFVQNRATGEVLQAVSLKLCDEKITWPSAAGAARPPA